MVIYLDLLILSTLVVNYVFIKTIQMIFHNKTNIFRMFLSLLLSVVSLLLYLLPYKIYFFIRYFIGIFIGFIAFSDKDIKIKIIKIVIYYILNMTFIGTLVVFKIRHIIPMIVVMLYVVVLYIIEHYQYVFKNEYYDIYINNIKYQGYLDTGNNSIYNAYPIVYINAKYFSDLYVLIDKITISTIGGKNTISIYDGPPLIYNNNIYKVYYAFDQMLSYDILLNNLMRGIIND